MLRSRYDEHSAGQQRLEDEHAFTSRDLCAAVIARNDLYEEVEIRPEQLFGDWVKVWSAISGAWQAGGFDLLEILKRLPDELDREAVKAELIKASPSELTPEIARLYAGRVAMCARRFNILKVADELARGAIYYDDEDLIATEDKSLSALAQGGEGQGDIQWFDAIGEKVRAEFEYNVANPADLRGYSTGFAMLDEALGGLEPDNYMLVGGRPSMGKSSFVFELVQRFARQDFPGLAVTSETSWRMFMIRMACSKCGLNYQREWKTGKLFDDNAQRRAPSGEWISTHEEMRHTLTELKRLPIAHKQAAITPEELYALCSRYKKVHGIKWLCIDTMNLLAGSREVRGNEQEIMAAKSKLIARIAHDLGVLVLATWQLSRATEYGNNKVPSMTVFKSSGAAEQDADIMLGLYRPGYYKNLNQECTAKIGEVEIGDDELGVLVLKTRDGQSGQVVTLKFEPRYARVRG